MGFIVGSIAGCPFEFKLVKVVGEVLDVGVDVTGAIGVVAEAGVS